jgi:Na+-transporting NADH:ubiquinone oxidoreductase subunit D
MTRLLDRLTRPLIDENPITLQILGICSALAVTTTLATALTMSLALTVVICLSATFISLIRNHIPQSVRLIIQITIISALVIVMDGLLRAFAYEMSQRLSVFVGLIVTNCLVMGRAEAFAMRHPPGASFADALGNGLGYSLILILVGTLREGLGLGTLLGVPLAPMLGLEGFTSLALMQRAPAAFFILGLLIWAIRALRPAQVEAPDYRVTAEGEDA